MTMTLDDLKALGLIKADLDVSNENELIVALANAQRVRTERKSVPKSTKKANPKTGVKKDTLESVLAMFKGLPAEERAAIIKNMK